MNGLSNPNLIDVLACPECGGELCLEGGHLQCVTCRLTYEIRNGIPLLYPQDIDAEHLAQEEELARTALARDRTTRKYRLSSAQWRLSKQEFLDVLRRNLPAPPLSIVNLGCGRNRVFLDLEKDGYLLVHLDIHYEHLMALQEHGASACVAGDATRLPLRKHSFDCALSIDLLHHQSEHLSDMLASFADLLRPGGLLLLEDINAWALFQLPKSILLPRHLHVLLRAAYHRLKRSPYRPADYEFPTSVPQVKRILEAQGLGDIQVHPNHAYPSIGPTSLLLYRLLARMERIRKYHNYHYMLSARRSSGSG
jgi:SAM-dependent methyltransferase